MENPKNKLHLGDELYLQNIELFENFDDYDLYQIRLEEEYEYQKKLEQQNSK